MKFVTLFSENDIQKHFYMPQNEISIPWTPKEEAETKPPDYLDVTSESTNHKQTDLHETSTQPTKDDVEDDINNDEDDTEMFLWVR